MKRHLQLLVLGLALLVMGVAIGDRFAEQAAFGLSGDFYSGVLLGMAVVMLTLSIVEAVRKR